MLLDRLDATGGIRFAGAEIAGQLSCRGAQITGADHDGNSLIATRTRIGGPAYLNNGLLSAGAVDLSGADVGGVVNLASASLGSNKSRCALVGDGMRASRDVVADNGNFSGGIRLTGAVVDGSFICRDTKLNASMEHYTLAVARLKVGGDVILDRLDSAGALLMAGADIGGRFCCRGSSLKGADPDGDALSANSLKVGGSVLLTAQFTAAGAVQLSHSTIGGSLRCSSAQLKVAEGERALTAQQINVTGAVLLDEGFVAAGSVSLRAASIARELRWEPGQPARGEVNLEGARTQQLTDNWASPRSLGYWPATRLRIAGFTYDRFGGDQAASVEQRLAWIRSQFAVHTEYAQAASPAVSTGQTPATSGPAPVFVTQPYKQLADVYRRAGQEDEARSVEIAMRRDLRTYGNLPKPARLLNWVLDVTIRYGFQTARALAGLAVLYIVVFVALLFAQHQGTLIEASNLQNTSLHPTALQCVTGYPCFYPARLCLRPCCAARQHPSGRVLAGERAPLARLDVGTRQLDGDSIGLVPGHSPSRRLLRTRPPAVITRHTRSANSFDRTRSPRLLTMRPDRCSYVCQGGRDDISWLQFWVVGVAVPTGVIAGLRTRQGWAAPDGACKLLLGHAQQVRGEAGDGRRIVRRPAGSRQPNIGPGRPRGFGR